MVLWLKLSLINRYLNLWNRTITAMIHLPKDDTWKQVLLKFYWSSIRVLIKVLSLEAQLKLIFKF